MYFGESSLVFNFLATFAVNFDRSAKHLSFFVDFFCSTSPAIVTKTLLLRTLSFPFYDAVTSGFILEAGTGTYR